MYQQDYDPFDSAAASTLLAALPIAVFLYFLALHPHRDHSGRRRSGISAPRAACLAWLTALAIAVGALHMPVPSALSALLFGALSGLIGIVWIVVAAMLLYTITLVTGQFAIVKDSITHLSSDRRVQVLLIAFSFGAIIEGTSGFGTPVAIAGAMLVGLGFGPLQSAVLNLIANTAPVAYGAIGTPILTLAVVSGLPAELLSKVAGRQLPFVSVLVPFWLVATFVFMERGRWRDVWDVWPATAVAGVTFALVQFTVASLPGVFLLTDVLAGLASVVALVLFLRVWQPPRRFSLRHETATVDAPPLSFRTQAPAAPRVSTGKEIAAAHPYTTRQLVRAWVPWALLIACVGVWGTPSIKAALNAWVPGVTLVSVPMPFLHGLVLRMPPVVAPGAPPESAIWVCNWLSAAGTGVFVAAVLSGLWLRLSLSQWRDVALRTARRMRVPILTILQVLALSFLTRYSGMDAILGLAFTSAGVAYPFCAALLGWLGVFLTGSDTASNALFGSLQRITAERLHLNPALIVAANSTGGVMGKMIDAQSITVATAACYEDAQEGDRQVGPIFRRVFWHSVALACVIGAIVMLQAYVVPGMVPSR